MARKIVFKNIKFRFIAILIFAVCTLIVWNLSPHNEPIPSSYIVSLQPQPKTILQDRDLSVYDFGGQIVDCFNNFDISVKDCELTEKQAREFIYKHWQDKKRAYIILEHNCHYCNETHVFIEPNEKGDWKIIWRKDFSDFERGFSSNISNETMTSVKFKTAVDVEEDCSYKKGTKYLAFFNEVGEVQHCF